MRGDDTSGVSGVQPLELLELLNGELATCEIEAEFYLSGGAVMRQAFNASPATANVSALFKPTRIVGEAAARVAEKEGLTSDWLNQAIKGYMDTGGSSAHFLELSNLKVFVPPPEYLLAVKCAAMRLGEDFRELDDVRYVLRSLNISNAEEALSIVTRYFSERQLAPATKSILEGLFAE